MSEASLVLSYTAATLVALATGALALFAAAHAKNRVIREQQRALASEQRLRRSQEAFMDNAHHEFRTPLQILSGHLQMLADLEPAPEAAALLAQAQAATRDLDRLVRNLLDLSALDQGTLMLHPTLVDLNTSLSLMAQRSEAGARARGLDFRTDLATLPGPVLCDEPRLLQALEALLDNALGFSVRGTLTFRLTLRAEGPGWRLCFDIEDEGPGLPADWHHLLKPFEQAERGLRRQRGGLGIGLPLAHGLVTLMGGRMGLAPRTAGTRVWLEVEVQAASQA